MTLPINVHTTVRDIVVKDPGARKVLELYGVDYCCGGGKMLKVAVAEAGVDLQQVVEALQQAAAARATSASIEECDWSTASLTKLTDHIENKHHAYMDQVLPRLGNLFSKVLRAHGANHGEVLTPLQTVFSELRRELEMHLEKEEQVLFPYIREMDASVAATGEVPAIHCGTVQNPIQQMEVEHESAGNALARMRTLTGNYTLPNDACLTFSALFETLQEMEADLHEHIHLENNILFPRTVAMACKEG